MNHDSYPDYYIADILRSTKVVALVGASPNPERPSYRVMAFLLRKGYRVIPVNPGQAGKEILGQPVVARLADIVEPIDMVDVFRAADALPSVVEAWGSNLPIVKAELERTLVEILGPSLQRGAGTRLVVTIGRVWLSSSTRGTGWAGANEDYLESTATLYDRSGRQLASYPIRSTESATGAGLLRLPEADQFRLRALARNNAWWVRRYIAG